MNKPLFRLGLAASLLGLCLLSYLLAFAQTGLGWEVPVAVMTQLTLLPRVSFALALFGLIAYFPRSRQKDTPRNVRAGYLILSILCLTLSIVLPVLHPEQWPGQFPILSTLAQCQMFPAWIICGVSYWRMGVRVKI